MSQTLKPLSAKVADASVELSFRIGQRVSHREYQGKLVTGVVRSLSVDGEQGLMISIALDAPIIIPASDGFREISIHHQTCQAHEFAPFDDRDELIAALLLACTTARDCIWTERVSLADCHTGPNGMDADGAIGVGEMDAVLATIDAAIAKAAGATA